MLCTDASDFGYAFSQEAGGWGEALAHERHNDPAFGLCSCPIFSFGAAPVDFGSFLPLEEMPNANSPGGVFYLGGGGARLSAGGTMKDGGQAKDAGTGTWMALGVTITNNVNFVQFEASFGDTNGGDGLLTVYWNTNEIGMLDQRVEPAGLRPYLLMLPAVVSEGCYTLSFRLDSLTNATSVTITNVVMGFVGIEQPSRLEVVSMGGNQGPTLKLTAAAGFNYLAQSSSNLTDWVPMALLVNTNGAVLFADPSATNASARFYRAVMP